MRPGTRERHCLNCCCSFSGRAQMGSSPPVPPCGNGVVRLWKAMATHTRHPDVFLPSTEPDQYLHKYHPAPAKDLFLDLTNFGDGCHSADRKNEFPSLSKWKFYPHICIPRCFSALWCWISDTARRTCFGCRETMPTPQDNIQLSMWETPLTTVQCCCGFPHPASAALFFPLICPCGWHAFSLPSSALWTLFLPILLPPFLPPTRMLFQDPWRTGRGEHVRMLKEHPCSPPVQLTLLPSPFVPIYLPKYHPYKNLVCLRLNFASRMQMLLLSESKKYLEIAQRNTYSQQLNSCSFNSFLVTPCQANCCSLWVMGTQLSL